MDLQVPRARNSTFDPVAVPTNSRATKRGRVAGSPKEAMQSCPMHLDYPIKSGKAPESRNHNALKPAKTYPAGLDGLVCLG